MTARAYETDLLSALASCGRRSFLRFARLAADAQDQPARRAQTYAERQDKINAWTVGLAAGLLEGAPLRLATEMSRVVNDGENLHLLPIVTRGPTENLNSLLYLRGIDLAIINSDSLDEYKVAFPDIGLHVTYLLSLFPSELHVFVRPEIQSLQDLAGKKVNFNTLGTAAAYSGPLIFSRLGINVEKTFIPASGGAATDAQGRHGGCRFRHDQARRRLRSRPMGSRLQVPAGELRLEVRGLLSAGVPGSFRLPGAGESRATALRRWPSPPSSPPTTGPPTRTVTSGWPASPITSSAASTGCRSPASIPTGRPSTSARRYRASTASPRRRNGWIARVARARESHESRVVACVAVALALGAPPQWRRRRRSHGQAASVLDAPDTERTKCLDRLAAEVGPALCALAVADRLRGSAPPENWVVSETTSPIDYSPVVVATSPASGAPTAQA